MLYEMLAGRPPFVAESPVAVAAQHIDQALTVAVNGLRGHGYSWAEIAARLGITRQAGHQRWGR